jgi:hypothetical protein
VLPEGAANIKTVLPYPVDSEGRDVKYTYLDVTGRPVVVITKRNMAPEHNTKFSVDYSFSTASIVREPLLLVAGEWPAAGLKAPRFRRVHQCKHAQQAAGDGNKETIGHVLEAVLECP